MGRKVIGCIASRARAREAGELSRRPRFAYPAGHRVVSRAHPTWAPLGHKNKRYVAIQQTCKHRSCEHVSSFLVLRFLLPCFFLVFAAKRRRDPAKIIWRCIVCFVSRLWKRRGPRHWRDPGPVLDQMRKCADSGRPGKKPTLVDKVAGKGGRETKKKGVSQLFRSGLIVKTAGRHQKRHQNGTRNGIQNCIQNDPKSHIPKI